MRGFNNGDKTDSKEWLLKMYEWIQNLFQIGRVWMRNYEARTKDELLKRRK